MRICIVPAEYKPIPPVKGGAVETIVQNFIDLNEKSNDIDFTVLSVWNKDAENACVNIRNTRFVFFNGNEKIDNIYYWLIYKIFKKYFNIILPDYILRLKMIKWVAAHQEEFDWILIEAGEIDCFKYYSKYLEPNKIIYHSHGEVKNKKRIENYIHYYMAVSDFIRDTWRKSYPSIEKNSFTLINGINQDKFDLHMSVQDKKTIRRQYGFTDGDIVLVFVGRIIQEKGVWELLNAMDYLPDTYKLLIIGSPNFGTKSSTSYEKKVRLKIERLKGRVKFTGYIPNEEIATYYGISDISVIPSMFNDPAPLVVIEAMAAGLPIVTTGSGGIREYCDINCAEFVERDEMISHSIANKIVFLGENEARRKEMGLYARDKAKVFTDENQFRKLVTYLVTIENKI